MKDCVQMNIYIWSSLGYNMDMSNMKTNMNIPALKVKWTQTLWLNLQRNEDYCKPKLKIVTKVGQGKKKKNQKPI
jgi:hypothetical protein